MSQEVERVRFIGLSLGGTKTDKSSLTVLEFYPNQKKIFLVQIYEKIKSNLDESSDDQIHRVIQEIVGSGPVHAVGVDVPLTLPKCLRCRLQCPGYKVCREPEIIWMNQFYDKRNREKKPRKGLSPYTERCAELYLGSQLEEPFIVNHPMSANMAPVFARGRFIQRRLGLPLSEVVPSVSVWRIGRFLKLNKTELRKYQRAFDGEVARKAIVEKLIEKDAVFIYRQDQKSLINNLSTFEAFFCGLSVVLSFLGKAEKRPLGFPKKESWPVFPREALD